MAQQRECDSQYKRKFTPVESMSMANPYKYKQGDSEWEKICKKYGEEDKSKPTKKRKTKSR